MTDERVGVIATPPPAAAKLGFWMTLAMVMGTMIGSGVFLLPASLAPYGWNGLYGWIVTIGGVLCLAYVLSVLVREMPGRGGPFGIIDAAFGPLSAFMVVWTFQIGVWVGISALAAAAISYLSMFAPVVTAREGTAALLAIGLVWFVTAVNLIGTRSSGRFQIATMLLKSLPLVAVLVIGAMLFNSGVALVTPYVPAEISAGGVGAAAALTLWAMTGFEVAATSHERVADADRVVPRATIIGALATGLIYLAICIAIIAYLPAAELSQSNAPFADFIAEYWGYGPSVFVGLFAALSAIGSLNGTILMGSEVPRSMAAAGTWPRWFAKCDARGTPVRALLVTGALVTVLVLLNYSSTASELFTFMAVLSASSTLLFYLACALATLRFLMIGQLRASFLLVSVVAAGIVYAVWTLYGAGLDSTGWTLLLAAVGAPIYWLLRRQKAVVPAE